MTPVLRTTGAFAINPPSQPQAAAPVLAPAQTIGSATELSPAGLDSLLDALLGDGITSARFGQACQLMTGCARPLSSVWNRLADPAAGQGHSALASVVRCLATRSDTDQQELRQHLQALHSWARAHHKQERWRLMVADLLEQLIPDRHCPAENRSQTLAEEMQCWLLEQPGLEPDAQGYSTLDNRLCQLLACLAQKSGCGHAAQERLVEWYRGWFALGWERSPALASAQTGAQACIPADASWRACGGALPVLEAALQGPFFVPDATLPASVLVLGGLWRTGEHVPTVIKRWIRASNSGDSAARQRLQDRCMAALQRAFCRCLYSTVARQGCPLRVQIVYRSLDDKRCFTSGLCTMASRDQLIRALQDCPQGVRLDPVEVQQIACVQAACGDPNTTVVDSKAMDDLFEEFLENLDMKAFLQGSGLLAIPRAFEVMLSDEEED